MQRDQGVLVDILLAAQDILAFKAGMDRTAFLGDAKTQAAIIHKLTIIGEAVRRLSPELRNAHPAIPWARIAGMRNRLIHQYDRVDLGEIWRAAERDIPRLIQDIEPLITRPEA